MGDVTKVTELSVCTHLLILSIERNTGNLRPEEVAVAIYFTINKSRTESLTVIFDADGWDRAKRYKQGLVADGAYREDQIEITGADSHGRIVRG